MDVQTGDQIDDDDMDSEIEDEEFKCCVCLELMYKPVVLACGHICCFWCLFRTMNLVVESNCPICRHPYNHFPNVCGLLHFVIQTLYPRAYKNRELQVAEEEKKKGYSSPQILENISALSLIPQLSNHESSSDFDVNSSPKKEHPSCATDSSNAFVSDKPGCSEVVTESQMYSEASATGSKFVKDSGEADDSYQHKALKKLFSVDFLCPACKSMLFRPVVLNCGHIHCEHCLSNQQMDILTCQVCESPNPNGLPKVCLVLDHLIAKRFQQLHGERRDSLLKQATPANEGPSIPATQTSHRTMKTEDYALWWAGRGPKVHIGFGCDYCGISPIIGDRYRCKDCKEKIGFDLCETCYARSSVLPGRFNQQHRPDHRFELQQPTVFIRNELWESDDDSSDDTAEDADGPPITAPPS